MTNASALQYYQSILRLTPRDSPDTVILLNIACPEFQHAVVLNRKEYEWHDKANEASGYDPT
jgi:hypothetical protein